MAVGFTSFISCLSTGVGYDDLQLVSVVLLSLSFLLYWLLLLNLLMELLKLLMDLIHSSGLSPSPSSFSFGKAV